MGALLYNIGFFFLFNLQVEEPITRRKTYPEKIEKQVSSLLPGNNRKITFGFLLCLVSVSWSKAVSCCSLSMFCFVSFSTFSAPDFSSFSFAVIALLACIKKYGIVAYAVAERTLEIWQLQYTLFSPKWRQILLFLFYCNNWPSVPRFKITMNFANIIEAKWDN